MDHRPWEILRGPGPAIISPATPCARVRVILPPPFAPCPAVRTRILLCPFRRSPGAASCSTHGLANLSSVGGPPLVSLRLAGRELHEHILRYHAVHDDRRGGAIGGDRRRSNFPRAPMTARRVQRHQGKRSIPRKHRCNSPLEEHGPRLPCLDRARKDDPLHLGHDAASRKKWISAHQSGKTNRSRACC